MKIAAIMAGEPRFCREFDLFLDSLANYQEIDWFMYFWSNSQRGGTHGFDLVAEPWLAPDQHWAWAKLEKELPNTHKIRSLVFADRHRVPSPKIANKAGETSVERMWGMYNSIYQADRLRRSWETTNEFEYDIVIRTRPDVGYTGSIDLERIAEMISNNPRIVITPNKEIHGYGGYRMNDMMAIGSGASIAAYCDCVSWIPRYYNQGLIFHPETQLAFHCAQQGLEIVTMDFGDPVLRKLGQQVPNGPYLSDYGRWA